MSPRENPTKRPLLPDETSPAPLGERVLDQIAATASEGLGMGVILVPSTPRPDPSNRWAADGPSWMDIGKISTVPPITSATEIEARRAEWWARWGVPR